MSFKKVSTFKEAVRFRQPSDEIGKMEAASFVGEFRLVPDDDVNARRHPATGIIRDIDIARLALVGADDATLEDVFANPIAVAAAARTYFSKINEGVATKNSET